MGFSLKHSKIALILSAIIFLALLLSLFALNSKANFIFNKNIELTEEINRLTVKVTMLTKKLNTDMLELAQEQAELEKTRNKLTQERLNNRQLSQKIEELEGAASAGNLPVESKPS